MSILISESYANPNTQLWATNNPFATNQSAIVLLPPGSINLVSLYANSSNTVFNTDYTSYSVNGGSYIATFSFYIEAFDYSGIPSTPIIPILIEMNAINSLGTFKSGCQYLYDIDSNVPGGPTLTICMPFVSDGTDANLNISVYNTSSVDVNFTMTPSSTSLLYLGTAIPQSSVFSPV